MVVENAPLISIDLIVEKNGKFLLGKRVNKPALGYYFTLGGRIFKNESIAEAIRRITKKELGREFSSEHTRFFGVFEHFYDDSFVADDISTHYVVLAYKLYIDEELDLPKDEHNEYHYFTRDELLKEKNVHKYVKDYFKES